MTKTFDEHLDAAKDLVMKHINNTLPDELDKITVNLYACALLKIVKLLGGPFVNTRVALESLIIMNNYCLQHEEKIKLALVEQKQKGSQNV